ncbi:MAG: type III polyketide synthase [Bacteroidota bacterium]
MNIQPAILSIGVANPVQRYSQEEIYNTGILYSSFYRSERVKQIFMQSDIEYRHFYFDLTDSKFDDSLDKLHERFKRGSIDIGINAINECLRNGDIGIHDIDYIIVVSCTGYLCPGLTSYYIKELSLRQNIQRADILGMGCAGAMPGLQRAYDFVKAYPDKKALLIAVEICSACYYIDDSLETVVGNAICSDGAAAIVVGMSENPSVPKIMGFETHLEPQYMHTVGFEQREGRLRIILSKDIRKIAGGLAKTVFNNLLKNNNLDQHAIDHWILHSGGRKVIDSLQEAMGFTDEQVRHSRCVLKNFGNMSSPTVLFVLKETMEKSNPKSGDYGVMLAMGPGLALEAALLRW